MTTPSPMPVAEALESLRAFHAVITDPYNKELLSTCIATLARAVEDAEWRPIETCPYRKRVLLFCPTNEGPRINATWVGMRHGGDSRELGYDEAFHLDTPYTTTENGIKKIVTCPIEDQRAWPTYWKPIDPPTADTARRERA